MLSAAFAVAAAPDPHAENAVPARPNIDSLAKKVYRYVNAQGREAFTNILDYLPPENRLQQEPAEFSRVSSQNDLEKEIDQPLAQQERSSDCPASASGGQVEPLISWAQMQWRDFSPAIAAGAILLLLLLATPLVLRKISAPDWARTLTKTIQLLAFISILAFLVAHNNRSLLRFRTPATACEQNAEGALAIERDPKKAYEKSLESYLKTTDSVDKEAGFKQIDPGLER